MIIWKYSQGKIVQELFLVFHFLKTFSYLLSELPCKKRVKFLCGVEVEVSFSALFSNVLVAFATVKTTDPRTQDCTVTLSSIPVNIYFYFKLLHILSSFTAVYRIFTATFSCLHRNVTLTLVHNCLVTSLKFNFLLCEWLNQTLGLKIANCIHFINSMLLSGACCFFPLVGRNFSMLTIHPHVSHVWGSSAHI